MPPTTRPAPSRRPAASLDEPGSQILDWIQLHARELIIGLVVVLALAAFWFFYQRTTAATERQAEAQFFAAQQIVESGNVDAAQVSLERVVNAYEGTSGGVQAAMQLARIRFEVGRVDEGLATLDRVEGSRAAREFAAGIAALRGAGLETAGRFGEAAAAYREAAERSRFERDRQLYRADAARALASGGQSAEAAAIWEELAADPTSPLSGEARVRLGELRATPAGRG